MSEKKSHHISYMIVLGKGKKLYKKSAVSINEKIKHFRETPAIEQTNKTYSKIYQRTTVPLDYCLNIFEQQIFFISCFAA